MCITIFIAPTKVSRFKEGDEVINLETTYQNWLFNDCGPNNSHERSPLSNISNFKSET